MTDKHLFLFQNATYNFETNDMTFEDNRHKFNTGYKWREPAADELKIMMILLRQFFPEEQNYKQFFRALLPIFKNGERTNVAFTSNTPSTGKLTSLYFLFNALGEYGDVIDYSAYMVDKHLSDVNPDKKRIIYIDNSQTVFTNADIDTFVNKLNHHSLHYFVSIVPPCPDILSKVEFTSIFTDEQDEWSVPKGIFRQLNFDEEFMERQKFAFLKIIINECRKLC